MRTVVYTISFSTNPSETWKLSRCLEQIKHCQEYWWSYFYFHWIDQIRKYNVKYSIWKQYTNSICCSGNFLKQRMSKVRNKMFNHLSLADFLCIWRMIFFFFFTHSSHETPWNICDHFQFIQFLPFLVMYIYMFTYRLNINIQLMANIPKS